MNSEISRLHQQLIQFHRNLAMRLGQTGDQGDAEAILREMDEVNFRVMMVGRLAFKETTDAMNARIAGVITASNELDQAIKEVEKIADLLKAVGKFLAIADKVIDAIKIV